MTLLDELQHVRCFAPAMPFGEQLAAVHVPFDELSASGAFESRVQRVAAAGGLSVVIGETGEGKSGLVSAALSMFNGWFAIPVPVSVPHPDGARPNQIPGLVLAGLAKP